MYMYIVQMYMYVAKLCTSVFTFVRLPKSFKLFLYHFCVVKDIRSSFLLLQVHILIQEVLKS